MKLTWAWADLEGGSSLHAEALGVFQVLRFSTQTAFSACLAVKMHLSAGGVGAVGRTNLCCHRVKHGWPQGSGLVAGTPWP